MFDKEKNDENNENESIEPENLNNEESHEKHDKNQEEIVKDGFWKKTKKFAAKVPFVLDGVALYFCAIDQKTPLWAKGIAFGALAWFVIPTDAIPDALPGVGFTDDAGAIAGALLALGKNVTDGHKEQARQSMLGESFLDNDENDNLKA